MDQGRSTHGAKGWNGELVTISDVVILDLSPQGRPYPLLQHSLLLAEKVTHFNLVFELELGQGREPGYLLRH